MALKLVKNYKEFLKNSDIVYRLSCCVFIFLFVAKINNIVLLKFTNLEAICKTAKKAANVMSLLSVTNEKYATQVPDVVAHEYYECLVPNKIPLSI